MGNAIRYSKVLACFYWFIVFYYQIYILLFLFNLYKLSISLQNFLSKTIKMFFIFI